ncbi:Flp family type IVb pilin [Geodermatophilus sp. SYSU D01119]
MTSIFAALQTLSLVVSDRLAAVKENEKGATMVEYALLVAAIAAVVATAVAAFTDDLTGLFERIIP